MIGFGPRAYLHTSWNKLDTLLVTLGLLDFVIFVLPPATVRVLRVLRVRRFLRLLRVARLLRVFRSLHTVTQLLMALRSSVEGLWHVTTVVRSPCLLSLLFRGCQD